METGTGRQPARQDSATPSDRPCLLSAASPQPPRQSPSAADDHRQAELSAYISRMVSEAPPLTGEQRDQLALLLHSPKSR